MLSALAIFIGGGLGAVARYGMSFVIGMKTASFPYATFAVNIIGALLIGGIAEYGALKDALTPNMRLFLITGFLGGFTTFSAFSLESAALISRGDYMMAGLYIALSIIGTILAVFAAQTFLRHLL